MLSNWVANREMKRLLKDISNNPSVESLKFNFSELYDLFFPKFKKVKDCIIISKKSVDELEMFFDRSVKACQDKTGYEAYSSDTRIDCYFEDKVSMMAGTQIALIALEVWALRLKQMDPNSKFCLIMYSNENRVEIRFHKVRENEIKWLADDINSYQGGAVGYVIV